MKLLLRVVAVAVLMGSISACDKAPQPPLLFGASAWPGYEPVYLARELGYFKDANLRLDDYASAAEVEQAFRYHKIHLAAITLERALLLRRDMPEMKIILLFDAETAPSSEKRPEVSHRMDVLVTRDDTIGVYHHELLQLVQGWRRALDAMHSDAEKTTLIMAQHEHMTPAQFNSKLQGFELYTLQRNQQLMMGEPPPVGAAIEAMQRALLSQGKLNIGADPSMLLEPTLLAEPEKAK